MVVGIAPNEVVPCVEGQEDLVAILGLDDLRELVNVRKPSAPVLTEVVVVNHRHGVQPVWTLSDICQRRGIEDLYRRCGVAAMQTRVERSLLALHADIRRIGAMELADLRS